MDGSKCLQELLQSLSANIRTEKDLSTEISAQNQMRSEALHELHIREAALKEAEKKVAHLERSNSLGFEERDRLKQEVTTLQSRPVIDPRMPMLLYDKKRRVSQLETEMSKLQEEISAASSAAQLHQTKTQALHDEIGQLKDDLQQSGQKVASLTDLNASRDVVAEQKIENMRLQLLNGVNAEKATMTAKHKEAVTELKGSNTRLIIEINGCRKEAGQLRGSLAAAQHREENLNGKIMALEKSQSDQETSEQNLRERFQRGEAELNSLRAQLHQQAEADKDTKTQVLERLNERICSIGGTVAENIDMALDYLLEHVIPSSGNTQTLTTSSSFHTAKSQATPNTAVPRAASRGSETSIAIVDAVDLLEAAGTPQTRRIMPAPEATSCAGPSQELPYSGRIHPPPADRIGSSRGQYEGHKGTPMLVRKTVHQSGGSQRNVELVVKTSQSQDQDASRSARPSGPASTQRKQTLEDFRSSIGLNRDNGTSSVMTRAQATFPTTPTNSPPQRNHMQENQQHSNSSARRLNRTGRFSQPACPSVPEDPTVIRKEQQVTRGATFQWASADVQKISQPANDNSLTIGVTENDDEGIAATNKFANGTAAAPRSILKKRKAGNDQQSTHAPLQRRHKRISTEGLGPIIQTTSSPRPSQTKSVVGQKSRKSTRLVQNQRAPDKYARAYTDGLSHSGRKI